MARLRDRLRQYLQDREPLALDGVELGFFPTKGRCDAAAVFRAATEAGADPWPLLAAEGRTLAAFLKRRPDTEQTLAARVDRNGAVVRPPEGQECRQECAPPESGRRTFNRYAVHRAESWRRGRYSVKETSEAPSTSRLAGRRRGKPAAVSVAAGQPGSPTHRALDIAR